MYFTRIILKEAPTADISFYKNFTGTDTLLNKIYKVEQKFFKNERELFISIPARSRKIVSDSKFLIFSNFMKL